MLEIERTFLVKKMPGDLSNFKFKKIKQGYISDLPYPLRIRQIEDQFEMTKKIMVGNDIKLQNEINLPLIQAEFELFWPLTLRSIEKTRYYIPLNNNLTAELDIFEGKLKGYMVVEVEFKTEGEMNAFVVPEWFGEDISLEDIGSSRKLSGMNIVEINKKLGTRLR